MRTQLPSHMPQIIAQQLQKTAHQIKGIRNARGKTQHQVAEYLGVSDRYYQYLESGRRNMTLATVTKLSVLYGVTTSYLMG